MDVKKVVETLAETSHAITAAPKVYPWLQPQWSFFIKQYEQQRVPHAFILAGPEGLGKYQLALAMAESLLCLAAQSEPCQNCRSCCLLQAGHHPDLWLVEPEDNTHVIKIDQIRQLNAGLQQTASIANDQVAVIYPADGMNTSAANALLKSLEEPQGQVVFILVTSQPGRLSATILSRSQILSCADHDETAAMHWLKQNINHASQLPFLYAASQGSPLKTLMLERQDYQKHRDELFNNLCLLDRAQTDVVSVAEYCVKQEGWMWLDMFQTLVNDLLKRMKGVDVDYLVNQDAVHILDAWVQSHHLAGMLVVQDKLMRFKSLAEQSVNTQLLCTDLLVAWFESKQEIIGNKAC